MATLTSNKVATTVPAKETNQGVVQVTAVATLTAALALDDIVQMVKVPKGARIVDMILSATDLDTGGSPAIVLDVGDGADTDRFIDGSTAGQAGGLTRLNAVAGVGYTYTADDTIDVHVQVGPATGAASGTITLVVTYSSDA